MSDGLQQLGDAVLDVCDAQAKIVSAEGAGPHEAALKQCALDAIEAAVRHLSAAHAEIHAGIYGKTGGHRPHATTADLNG